MERKLKVITNFTLLLQTQGGGKEANLDLKTTLTKSGEYLIINHRDDDGRIYSKPVKLNGSVDNLFDKLIERKSCVELWD